jgi:hypothetical protein
MNGKGDKMNFEERINSAIREMFKIGYKPHIFMDMRIEHGTIEAIKRLIHSEEVPSGFTTLWEKQRLDLSVENIIQEPEWTSLFTDGDRQLAKKRLKAYNFALDK